MVWLWQRYTNPAPILMQGKFLALMMDQFLKYNTGESDHEVIQCMFCLFGISVSVFASLTVVNVE